MRLTPKSCALFCLVLSAGGTALGNDAGPAALDALQGTWTVTAAEQGGKPFDAIKGGQLTLKGEAFDLKTAAGNHFDGKVRLNTEALPHTIDFELSNGPVWLGIYSLNKTTFRLNYVEDDGNTKRPGVFATTAETPGTVIVMRRVDPASH